CGGEVALTRRYAETVGLEQTLEMLPRVDQPARPQDSALIQQCGEWQAANLEREPEGCRHDVRDAIDPLRAHELALLAEIAIARQDHVHPGALVAGARLDRREQRLAHRTARGDEQQQRAAAVAARASNS